MESLRTFVRPAVAIVTFAIAPQLVSAATIIDTGVIPCATGMNCEGNAIDTHSYAGNGDYTSDSLAARFTLTRPAYVDSLEAWISLDQQNSGTTLTFAIYGNGPGGSIPDPTLQYFAGQVSVVDHPGAEQGYYGDQWQGLYGLDLPLLPGTYWLSLEDRPGDQYYGYAVLNDPNAGPFTPGDAYAYDVVSERFGGQWQPITSGPEWALRILGDVPEPGSELLASLALTGIALARARSCTRRGR